MAGAVSKRAAILVQQAVIVGLVIGSAFPPIRLDLIKNLPHPMHAGAGCRDPDCTRLVCLGNRLEVIEGLGSGDNQPSDSEDVGGDLGGEPISSPVEAGQVEQQPEQQPEPERQPEQQPEQQPGQQQHPEQQPDQPEQQPEEQEQQQHTEPGQGSELRSADSTTSGTRSARSDPSVLPTPSDDAMGPAVGAFAPGVVTLHIQHGKNDRRASAAAYRISFQVPAGPLSRLLLAHVRYGHLLLTQENPDAASGRLFVLDSGKAFDDSTFVQYWSKAMRQTAGKFNLPYFPPSKARTMFVEAYTEQNGGMEPSFWDGASAIMGNTPQQWNASYRPSKRQRDADKVVGSYSEFLKRQNERS